MKKIYGKKTEDKIIIRIGNYEFVVRKILEEYKTFKDLLKALKILNSSNNKEKKS